MRTTTLILPPNNCLQSCRCALAVFWLSVWIAGFCGCAKWTKDSEELVHRSQLPPAPKSPDLVEVDTVIVRFSEEESIKLPKIWMQSDESFLDIELRRQLDTNGLRAGILYGEIPVEIREQLERSANSSASALEEAGLAADADTRMRKLRCFAGKRKDVNIRRQVNEVLHVLTKFDGNVSGQSMEGANAIFDMRVVPDTSGAAEIKLVPEIQYGQARQSFVSSEFGVRPEMKREQQRWEQLAISARLRPGQVLMIGSVQPTRSIGEAFFTTNTAEQTREHTLLLIRLVGTQLDGLFDPDTVLEAQARMERSF